MRRLLGLIALYSAVHCAPAPEPEASAPALRIQFLTGEVGCGLPAHDPTPPGVPPADAASIQIEVFDDARELVGGASAAVHAGARCVDAAEREFSCPFDGANDGERSRQLVLANLPSNSPLTIRAKVLDEAGIVRWSGRRHGVVLEAEGQSLVRLTLTRHSASTCAGRMADPRGFGTATPLSDGRVLLAGGFAEVEECGSSCLELTATASADLYDPATGLITPVQGGLSVARGMHTAVLLPDGRVVVVGGTDSVTLDLSSDARAPLLFPEPSADSGPRDSFEVFDPASETFNVRGSLRDARLSPAVAALANDTVLIVGGGVRTGDGPAPTAEALKTSDVVNPQADGGVAADAAPGPSPRSARRGGSLIRLPGADNDGPWLLAGGAGEADRPMELLRDGVFVAPADGGWGAYDAASAPNLFAPAVVDLGDGEHVVVAGGAVAAPLAFERRWELQWRDRTEVLVVSAADGAIVDTAGDNAPRLYLGGSGLLEGGALLTGGIVVSTGGDATVVPVVTDSTLRVAVSGATSPGPRLAQARAGHASATMADGTVVVAGGLTLPTADRLATLRDSVELLNAGDAP